MTLVECLLEVEAEASHLLEEHPDNPGVADFVNQILDRVEEELRSAYNTLAAGCDMAETV